MQMSVAALRSCLSTISSALRRDEFLVHNDNELNGKQEWKKSWTRDANGIICNQPSIEHTSAHGFCISLYLNLCKHADSQRTCKSQKCEIWIARIGYNSEACEIKSGDDTGIVNVIPIGSVFLMSMNLLHHSDFEFSVLILSFDSAGCKSNPRFILYLCTYSYMFL